VRAPRVIATASLPERPGRVLAAPAVRSSQAQVHVTNFDYNQHPLNTMPDTWLASRARAAAPGQVSSAFGAQSIVYPTGGGVGLIGMWKAFEEMEQLGWVQSNDGKGGYIRPKMIAVQAAGCAPVARAFDQHEPASQMWQNAHTFASGLRVPKPYGDYLILDIVRKSNGAVLALSDEVIFASLRDWASKEGIYLSPEGAAATAAYDHLLTSGFLQPTDRVVLFNTGSGNKYTDVIAQAFVDATQSMLSS